MFFLKSKRGSSEQIDWVISLSLFLFFCLWFFLIIKPYSVSNDRNDFIIDSIKDGIDTSLSNEIFEIPVYVNYSYSGSNLPIIVDKPVNWTDYVINENVLYVDYDGKIIFLDDFEQGRNVIIFRSSLENYTDKKVIGLIREKNGFVSVDSEYFIAYYSNNILNDIYFNNSDIVSNAVYDVDGSALNIINSSVNSSQIFVKNYLKTNLFEFESWVFAHNKIVSNIINPVPYISSNIRFNIKYDIDENFDRFTYAGLIANQVILLESCKSGNYSNFGFSDSEKTISFYFNRPVYIEVCPESGKNTLDISANLTQELYYTIMISDGVKLDNVGLSIWPDNNLIGIKSSKKGLSSYKIIEFDKLTNSEIRELWSIPSSYNFQITIYNETYGEIYQKETKKPYLTNVYVKQYRSYMMDEVGDQRVVFVNIKMW
jgi:hypothetical protein